MSKPAHYVIAGKDGVLVELTPKLIAACGDVAQLHSWQRNLRDLSAKHWATYRAERGATPDPKQPLPRVLPQLADAISRVRRRLMLLKRSEAAASQLVLTVAQIFMEAARSQLDPELFAGLERRALDEAVAALRLASASDLHEAYSTLVSEGRA